jgi:hypothetical protein
LAPLAGTLKEIMALENLKIILKPYERIGFEYLSIRGKINNIEGYFEKDREFDVYTDLEQQNVENYLKYLTTT